MVVGGGDRRAASDARGRSCSGPTRGRGWWRGTRSQLGALRLYGRSVSRRYDYPPRSPPEAVVVGDGCGWRATSVASSVGGIYIVGSAVSRVWRHVTVM